MSQTISNDYVAMGQHVCPVCIREHDSGEILIHKQMRSIPEDKRVTGWGMCPECQALKDRGYVALIEADPARSHGSNLEDICRTGRVMSLKKEAYEQIFNVPVDHRMIAFVEPEALEKIFQMYFEQMGEYPPGFKPPTQH